MKFDVFRNGELRGQIEASPGDSIRFATPGGDIIICVNDCASRCDTLPGYPVVHVGLPCGFPDTCSVISVSIHPDTNAQWDSPAVITEDGNQLGLDFNLEA